MPPFLPGSLRLNNNQNVNRTFFPDKKLRRITNANIRQRQRGTVDLQHSNQKGRSMGSPPTSSAKGTAAMPAQEEDAPMLPLYVLIPPSPLFAAHWSLFLPDTSSFDAISRRQEESSIGRRIHVSGDRLNGYHLEIIRNYNVSKHKAVSTRSFNIALTPSSCLTRVTEQGSSDSGTAIQKDDDEGGGYVDNQPVDAFERAVLQTEAPGPSLNSAQRAVGLSGRRVKTEVKDCQWWVKQVVTRLFEQGLLMPLNDGNEVRQSGDPLQLVQNLPMH